MGVSNLLSITLRNTSKQEYAAIAEDLPKSAVFNCSCCEHDVMSIDGRIIDILGNLTDKQVEALMRIGYDNAVNDMIDIITTCSDITDEELIDLYFAKANPSGAPQRLRIVRTTEKPSEPESPDNPVTPDDPETPQDPPGEAPDANELPESVVPDDSDFDTTNPELVVNRKYDNTASKNNITGKITLKACDTNANYETAFPDVYYTIEPADGTTCNVKVEYLDNGRLLITGDNMKIIAKGGQKDNLIIMGNNNYIDTNSGDDTVRVAMVRDASSTKFITSASLQATGNKVLTGDGNDYVQSKGYNAIDLGGGNDRILTDYGWNSTGANTHTSFKNAEESVEITGQNNGGYPDGGYTSKNSSSSINGEYTWSLQNGFGDCQTLSTFNSLLQKANFSDYIEITPDGDNKWNVLFKKSNITQVVKSTDIVGGSVMGDKDMQIIEAAMRVYMKNNYGITFDNDDNTEKSMGLTSNYKYISKLLFNVTTSDAGMNQYALEEKHYKWFVDEYNAGNISQVSFATNDVTTNSAGNTNGDLGIVSGHAYALIGGQSGVYVDLVNPWDSNDRIRLDWEDFKKYFKTVMFFGDTFTKFDEQFGINIPISTIPSAQSSPETSSDEPKTMYFFENEETKDIEKKIEDIQAVLNTAPKRLKLIS